MEYSSHIELTYNTHRRLIQAQELGEIHNVFNHAINIKNNDGSLFTLVDDSFHNGPNCIKIFELDFSSLNVKEATSVHFLNHRIIIQNKLIINYSDYHLHQESVLTYPKNRHHLIDKIKAIKNSTWYKTYQNKYKENFFMKTVTNNMDINKLLLSVYIKRNDLVGMQKHTLENFIGLGVGLTPSGDDFLSGLAYVASLNNYPNSTFLSILQRLKKSMKDRTNLISYQQYKMALKKEVRTEISISLGGVLSDKDYTETEESIKKILTIGSTSGFDILQGMLFALEISYK